MKVFAANRTDSLSMFEWVTYISACVIKADDQGEAATLTFIDPMQRRRLSALAKVSLGVMQECTKDEQNFQIVYASRHGDLFRTTDLLNQLAMGDDVSPMGFSLAVLNGTPGIFSIATANRSPCSAVSAGPQTFQMGLLEASIQASQSAAPVLFVYADAPVPEVYGATKERSTGPMHAVALFLHGLTAPGRIQLKCMIGESTEHLSEDTVSLAFARSWSQKSAGQWADGSHQFSWSFK